MSDSNHDHRRPQKSNATLDVEVRGLHEDFKAHVKHENEMHSSIFSATSDMAKTISQVDAKLDKYVFAGRIVHGALVLAASGIFIYQASLHARMSQIQHQLDEVDRRVEAWIPYATKWGDELEEEDRHNAEQIREIKQELKELRRRLGGR